MEQFDIQNFRDSITNYSVEQLEQLANDLREEVSMLILNSDAIMKAAIVDALLQERKSA